MKGYDCFFPLSISYYAIYDDFLLPKNLVLVAFVSLFSGFFFFVTWLAVIPLVDGER
jgi:hypothetical protein